MIHNKTFDAAYPLAEKLASKGLRVTPIETTPLDQLIGAGHVCGERAGEATDIVAQIINGGVHKDISGVCKHDVVMEELVEVISKTVKANLHISKNVVNPIIQEAVNSVEKGILVAKGTKKSHIAISPILHSNIWNSGALSDMVEKYGETRHNTVPLNLSFPFEVTRDSVLQLAKTGASAFDRELESLFSSFTDDVAERTFKLLFSENSFERASNLNEVLTSVDKDGVILVHLYARKLMQEIPQGVNSSLEEYKLYISDILSQSGKYVYSLMEKRDFTTKGRQLIASFPTGLSQLGNALVTIRVNGDVYAKWLKDGGTPEAIFGSFVSSQERGYTALLEDKEQFEAHWNRRLRLLETTERFDDFNNAQQIIDEVVTDIINNDEVVDDLVIELSGVSRETLHGLLKDSLNGLSGKFYNDIYKTVRKVICNVIFPHTDALNTLIAIDDVSEEYPTIDIREAGLLATIEIISTWIAKLCRVDKVAINSEE